MDDTRLVKGGGENRGGSRICVGVLGVGVGCVVVLFSRQQQQGC